MSGPIDERDLERSEGERVVEAREGRPTTVGGLDIVRVLPTKGRRTVGAWCFVDLMAPDDILEPPPMEVGPHPHIGLSTVTWLLSGEALHSDSLGTEQVIRAGQLNLMTAGHGIAHAELGLKGGRGVQMWVAQPEKTRHGSSAFEHHAELPLWEFGGGEAAVLIGSLGDVVSPATAATPLVGAEFRMQPGSVDVPTDPAFEYALVPLDGAMRIAEHVVEPGWIGFVEPGHESVTIEAGAGGGRAMLLGGEPLGERIQMWWNFVARTKEEITEAWRAWQEHDTERFDRVPSKLPRIDAPRPPWVRSTD
ncbi:MAG: pirin family protein [Acidimicrobiia bacterium]